MTSRIHAAIAAGALLLPFTLAVAQESDEPLPDLDELLGLDEGPETDQEPSEPRDEAVDPLHEELTRELAPSPVDDRFEEAALLMGETARRLTVARDAGLATQRLQEEILRKLDQLIEEAKNNQGGSSQSASQSRQDGDQQQPNQRQGQPQENQEPGRGDNNAEIMPPARQEAVLGPAVSGGAEWGALPQRIRDALLQSSDDTFSSMYRALTEAYYRRLAEEERQ